jgi:hypothetical protein
MDGTVAHWVARWGVLCVAVAATATVVAARAWERHAKDRRPTSPTGSEPETPTDVVAGR